MPKLKPIMVTTSFRLPQQLSNRIDDYVRANSPAVKNRAHAIIIALYKLLDAQKPNHS
jgi:Arc/MetJ-type ribon-helix-helix transcriptional regulator